MSRFKTNSADRELMELAISQQARCENTPKVGAVLVTNKSQRITGFRHEIDTLHAEAVVLKKSREQQLDPTGGVLYVTMEPCNEAAKNCAQAIIDSKIEEVVIGTYDLNPDINRLGWEKMRDNGIKLRDFDSDLIDKSRRLNPVEHFHKKIGPSGHGKFAYKQNGNKGVFDLQFSKSDDRMISFGCSSRGADSIYIYGKRDADCAEARKAAKFCEIDNPDAYQYDYAATAEIASITIVRTPEGCALLEVTEVDHFNNTMKFNFKIRPLPRDK